MENTEDNGLPTDDQPEKHSDEALLAQVKKHRQESDSHLSEWKEDARQAYNFYAGDQWSEEDRITLTEMLRVPIVYNRIGPMVDSVAGSEINNRQQVQYIPRQVGDSKVSEIFTGAADYFRDACDAEDEESDAFLDLLICGVGVTETYLDYIDDPQGMVKDDRRDPLTMRWDPSAKKKNLVDKKWAQREEWLTQEEVELRWPDKKDQIEAESPTWPTPDNETQPHDATFDFLYLKNNSQYDKRGGKLRVTHEQWYELETYYYALDPFTQKAVEFSKDDYEKLNRRLKKLGIDLQAVKKQRKRWYQVFIVGGLVLEFDKVACNECSWNFITGKRDRNKNYWYGIVKALIDPQMWANKFFSQTLHIINTNAKGGMVIEKGATDNLRAFKANWAKSDGVTVVEDGAISGNKLMPKPVPIVPPQISQMLQFSITSMRDVSGLNVESMGLADRNQPGILEAQRKQSALQVLAPMFDSLRRYRKEQGRLMAKFIREYLSDGRLIRILGGDGLEKYIPLIRDPETMEYDVIVDEAATTTNMKERTFGVLQALAPMLEKMGVPFTPQLLEYLPLPAGMVEDWQKQMRAKAEEMQRNPPPPPPQVITANANMLKAQSQVQKDQREAAQQPAEDFLRMRELDLQAREQDLQERELAVRERETEVDGLQAQAAYIQASLAPFQNPQRGNGGGPQPQ